MEMMGLLAEAKIRDMALLLYRTLHVHAWSGCKRGRLRWNSCTVTYFPDSGRSEFMTQEQLSMVTAASRYHLPSAWSGRRRSAEADTRAARRAAGGTRNCLRCPDMASVRVHVQSMLMDKRMRNEWRVFQHSPLTRGSTPRLRFSFLSTLLNRRCSSHLKACPRSSTMLVTTINAIGRLCR